VPTGAIETSREEVSALFIPEGRNIVPTTFALGPWRPDAARGSAVPALFASALDEAGMTVARITVGLLGAVRFNHWSCQCRMSRVANACAAGRRSSGRKTEWLPRQSHFW
jgi:hypothetical protein